jgi:hypothetical protein
MMIMAALIPAGKGIRYQEHPTRRHGNKLDRYPTVPATKATAFSSIGNWITRRFRLGCSGVHIPLGGGRFLWKASLVGMVSPVFKRLSLGE